MKKAWIAAGEQLVARAAHVLEHHPRQVTAIVAAILLTAGGGAYAVASLGPDAALLPVRQILVDVQPLPLEAQAEALDTHTFSLYSSADVRPTDTPEALLARMGINDPAAAAFLRQDPTARAQVLGANGRTFTAEATDTHNLLRLSARWAIDDKRFQRLVIERNAAGGFAARMETAPLVASQRVGSGTIKSTLIESVLENGIPDAVATQMVDILGNDIDFRRDLRVGDRFAVVYETLEGDGEPLRTGRVISTEFVNGGHRHEALWFQQPGQSAGGYFDFHGRSLDSAFLAWPVAFTRISSRFSMRYHPILHQWKKHEGVDFAAPTGTPVRSVGDGQVAFAGWQNGYGNVIHITHGKGWETVYAHLSRIGVHPHEAVQRGEVIGAVGMTGWATGPHLHFETRKNGTYLDPLEVAKQETHTELSAQARPAFDRLAASMQGQLAAAAAVNMVAAR